MSREGEIKVWSDSRSIPFEVGSVIMQQLHHDRGFTLDLVGYQGIWRNAQWDSPNLVQIVLEVTEVHSYPNKFDYFGKRVAGHRPGDSQVQLGKAEERYHITVNRGGSRITARWRLL